MSLKCFKCDKACNKAPNLRKHILSHYYKVFFAVLPARKPFSCPDCNYTRARDRITLVRHYAFYHEKLFVMTAVTPEQAQFTLKASGYKRISKGDGGESGTPEYRDKENALPRPIADLKELDSSSIVGDLEGRNCAEIEEDAISFNGKKNSVNLTEDCPTVTPTVPESVEDKDKGEQEEKDLESVVLTEKGEEDYFVENDDQKREDGEQKKDDEQKEDGEQKKESREEKMTTSLGEMIISQEKMATTQEKMVTSQGADQSSKGSSSSPFLMKIVDESQPSDEECGLSEPEIMDTIKDKTPPPQPLETGETSGSAETTILGMEDEDSLNAERGVEPGRDRILSGEGRSTPDGIIYEQALGEMKRIEEGNKKILEDETTKSSADVLNKRPGGATVFSQPEAKRSKMDDSSEEARKKIKKQLKTISRRHLEELVASKMIETVANRSEIGQLRRQVDSFNGSIEMWRTRANALDKQRSALFTVIKTYVLDLKAEKENRNVAPVRITRSVGLQVRRPEQPGARNPLVQQRPATTITGAPSFRLAHPAPLPPIPPSQPMNPGWRLLTPKPTLTIQQVEQTIVLTWTMNLSDHDTVASYHLYVYQEQASLGRVDSSLWKNVGAVTPLPLPMACRLENFSRGRKYYFAVNANYNHGRFGPFSDPVSIVLS